MVRSLVVTILLALAAAGLWLLLGQTYDAPGELSLLGRDGSLANPRLTVRNRQQERTPKAPPDVGDPVDYVISSLGAIPADDQRAHLLALIEANPAFLQGLIDWIAAPDDRPLVPPGFRTTDTAQAYVHRILVLIGEPAVAPLARLLMEGRGEGRYRAVKALEALGHAAAAAVAPLSAAARNEEEDRYLRAAAVDALGAIGEGSREVLPLVHATLRDTDCEEELGLACARNLIRIGGASKEVFETCGSVLMEDWYKASAFLLKGLEELGPAARPFIQDLLHLFDKPRTEEGLWNEVAPVLQAIGANNDEVLSFLAGMIHTSSEEGVKDGGAARALAHLGERGRLRLLELGAERGGREHLTVLRLLYEGGHDKGRFVAHVARFLLTADPSFRAETLDLLAQAQAPAEHVLPVVRPYLEDSSEEVRTSALLALGSVTEPSRAVVRILQDHAEGKSEPLVLAALAALERTALNWPDRVLSIYLKALEDPRVQVAWVATANLAQLAEAHRGRVIRAWLAALDDPRIAEVAAWSLRDHASGDRGAREAFRSMITNPSADLRSVAVHALGKAGQSRDLDALLRSARDEVPQVRVGALRALTAYASRFRERILGAWVAALKDDHWWPRQSAARELQQLGTEAADTLPALEEARKLYATQGYHAGYLTNAIKTIRWAAARP